MVLLIATIICYHCHLFSQVKFMLLPVVLAGGIGSRLWPVSRASLPKQFIHFPQHLGSLFQNTIHKNHISMLICLLYLCESLWDEQLIYGVFQNCNCKIYINVSWHFHDISKCDSVIMDAFQIPLHNQCTWKNWNNKKLFVMRVKILLKNYLYS